MNARFDVAERWPELFEPLTPAQREGVTRALAAGLHEGWQPQREDVADLADYARGAITFDEYQARSLEKADRIADAVEEAKYAALSEAAERGELRIISGAGWTVQREKRMSHDAVADAHPHRAS